MLCFKFLKQKNGKIFYCYLVPFLFGLVIIYTTVQNLTIDFNHLKP